MKIMKRFFRLATGIRVLACGHTIYCFGDFADYMDALLDHVWGCPEAKRILREYKEAGLLGRKEGEDDK